MVEEAGQPRLVSANRKSDKNRHRKQPYENKTGNTNDEPDKKFNSKLGIVTDLDHEDWQMPTFLDS